MFLWSHSLHIWQIHWVFCLIFAGIKTKTSQSSLYSTAFFKILKEPALVQKPTIPHMKALIFSYLEPGEWGRGIIMELATPTSLKGVCYFSFWGRGGQEGWFKKKIFGLGQMSAPHECTDTNFMPQKCIFDGLTGVFFRQFEFEHPVWHTSSNRKVRQWINSWSNYT